MPSIISAHNVGKLYHLIEGRPYFTLRDSITQLLKNPVKTLLPAKDETVWVLKDVDFDVKEGEILGILGNNGAGKSTLLKILSRITPPTQGDITIRGRIGSLLEVGTGFHPELSGRENIYLNGAILGMTRAEVQSQFDTIVEFAEVEKFLDTPMKHYSSGMYMRLAFAVAAHLQSEILLVDEVLAVGDVEFQKKCLGKMGDIAKQGRTILFVSHNMGAVQNLCSRCIVLEKGRLIADAPTKDAITTYLAKSHAGLEDGVLIDRRRLFGLGTQARITKIRLATPKGERISTVDSTKPFEISFDVFTEQKLKTGWYLSIKDENRRPVLLLSSGHLRGKEYTLEKGKNTITCSLEATHLASGRYSIDCALTYPNREQYDFVEDALFFNVTKADPYKSGFDYNQQWGSYYVDHAWTHQRGE